MVKEAADISSSAGIWSSNLVLLMVIQTIDLFTYNMITPVIAQYAFALGVAISLSGVLVSAFALAALFARPFSGFLADRLGRKRIVVVAIIVSLAVQLGYVFISNIAALMLLRIIHGAIYALFGTAIVALATQSIPPERQSEGMGWFGTSYVLANALGPALGVWLVGAFGYSVMFAVGAVATAVSLVLVVFVRVEGVSEESASSPEGEATANKKSCIYISDFISLRSIPLAISAAAFMAIWGVVITYVVLVADARGVFGIGAFFVVNSATLLLTRPLAGRITDKRGLTPVFVFSAIFEAISLTLLFFANALWMFLVGAACKALGSGTVLPSVQARCGMLEPPERRGVAMSTYLLGTDLGNVIGPLLGGAVAGAIGINNVFLTAYPLIAICVFAFIAFCFIFNKKTTF